MPFYKGHTIRNTGKTHFKKGFIPWITGRHHTENSKKKMRESSMGQIAWNKGIPSSEETKRKISLLKMGNKNNLGKHWKRSTPVTAEERKNKSRAMMGNQNGKGQKLSQKHKKILSETHKGNKNPMWQGGISFEPYSIDWTQTLRRSIRERDKYVCQLCGMPQGDRALDVHHIDYNKKNCDPKNLITLCSDCNLNKVNSNRNYWTNYFNTIIEDEQKWQ